MLNPINPTVFNNKTALNEGLKKPFLVIRDALIPERAEQLYTELTAVGNWDRQSLVKPNFVYQRDKIGMGSEHAPECLNQLYAFLTGSECLTWMTEISGRRCDDFHGAAAIFKPGDQITEHNDRLVFTKSDGTKTVRVVTFNLYLTKRWDERWGGRFVWKNPFTTITPTFNTLVLFNVGHDTNHWVEPIAEGVEEKRLSVTGWFLNSPNNSEASTRKLNLKI